MKIFLSLCILPFTLSCVCVCVFGIEWLLPKRFLSGLLGFPGNFAREAKVWLDLGFSESLDICGI